jgi:crotonobetainyl-CoA:carnitine CoA-transferase CaiB-like acyl-CoA transferase
MLKQVGTSGQIALGKQLAGKYFEVSTREDGTIELKPMIVIPESQAWAHTPEMKKRLAESSKWMAENPPRETNLDEFERIIEAKWAEKATSKTLSAAAKRTRKAA